MNPRNEQINEALKNAQAALQCLDAHGSTVACVALGTRNPVLVLAAPPTSDFIKGELKERYTAERVHRIVRVAQMYGCEVQWTEIRPLAREALQA